jgi:hypothetical protein
MKFFKVYIVKDDLVRIWERDCLKLTDSYAYVRALRSRGTESTWRICLSMTSDKYFITLRDAKKYIAEQRQIKINKLKADVEKLKDAINYHQSKKSYYELDNDWDYDDRGINYESVL